MTNDTKWYSFLIDFYSFFHATGVKVLCVMLSGLILFPSNEVKK